MYPRWADFHSPRTVILVNIFISYRRDDSMVTAALLYRELASRPEFPDAFMDIDDIGYGDDFVTAIETALHDAEVVLVVIGPRWTDMLQARLRGDDWVHHEVATALRLRASSAGSRRPPLRVLPVLIGGAAPPLESSLPADLAALARLGMLKFDERALKASINALLEATQEEDFQGRVRRLQEERRRIEAATDTASPAIARLEHRVETKRSSVFISYSRLDANWLLRLQPHFESLRFEYPSFELWDDTRIPPGADWRQEIRTALASARVAVLLVSKSFLASKFIQNEELPQLLSSAQDQGTLLLAVLLSPSRFEHIGPLAKFQTINPPSKTLAEMSGPERERIFVRLTERIASTLKAS